VSDSPIIECTLRPITKYGKLFAATPSDRRKLGSYHGSYFWGVSGFGRDKWMVTVTVEDFEAPPDLSPREIVEACIRHLNQPVGKRKKRAPYGHLELYAPALPSWSEKTTPGAFTFLEDGAFQALLIIDQRNNKNFWGKGQRVPRYPSRRSARK